MNHKGIGILVIILALAGCVTPTTTKAPALNKVTPTSSNTIKLLFVYSPGCSHCAYQTPIIEEFAKKYPEVELTLVSYSDLNLQQKELLAGIHGHPIMVFYVKNHVKRIVGETPMATLEEEFQSFKRQQDDPGSSTTTTGSYNI